jgi:tripartite-type tricarboxylate transporter receptor subunit TctC
MHLKPVSLVSTLMLVLALLVFMPFGDAQAAFPDKPITFIVPHGAGGGTDGLARALASRLEKILGVSVVVKNEPGSGGRKGTISLFKSTPDGYTIGLPHFAALMNDKVISGRKVPIDFKKFAVLIRADTTVFYIHVSKKSPYKSVADLKAAGKPIRFGASGVGSPSSLGPTALGAAAGFEVKFVTGHKNLAEAALSVARGDVDAAAGSYTHFRGVINDVRPIVYLSDEKPHHLPTVPTVVDAGYPKLAAMGVPWVVAAPPGTPEDRQAVLRKALTQITTSDEYKKWAQDKGYNPSSQGPAEFWKSLDEMEQVYLDIKPLVDKLKKMYPKKK